MGRRTRPPSRHARATRTRKALRSRWRTANSLLFPFAAQHAGRRRLSPGLTGAALWRSRGRSAEPWPTPGVVADRCGRPCQRQGGADRVTARRTRRRTTSRLWRMLRRCPPAHVDARVVKEEIVRARAKPREHRGPLETTRCVRRLIGDRVAPSPAQLAVARGKGSAAAARLPRRDCGVYGLVSAGVMEAACRGSEKSPPVGPHDRACCRPSTDSEPMAGPDGRDRDGGSRAAAMPLSWGPARLRGDPYGGLGNAVGDGLRASSTPRPGESDRDGVFPPRRGRPCMSTSGLRKLCRHSPSLKPSTFPRALLRRRLPSVGCVPEIPRSPLVAICPLAVVHRAPWRGAYVLSARRAGRRRRPTADGPAAAHFRHFSRGAGPRATGARRPGGCGNPRGVLARPGSAGSGRRVRRARGGAVGRIPWTRVTSPRGPLPTGSNHRAVRLVAGRAKLVGGSRLNPGCHRSSAPVRLGSRDA